jgi:ribosomal protein S18 acetylase RimI-like enzyme
MDLYMIEAINAENLKEVLPLIRQYQEFYSIDGIDDDKNHAFFTQFGENSNQGCLFGYRLNGSMVAFATVYFSFASSIISKVAVMNDLYTSEHCRQQGIAKALIKHCEQYGKQQGAARLQWVTAASNKTAQKLYTSLGAKQSTWEFFSYCSEAH